MSLSFAEHPKYIREATALRGRFQNYDDGMDRFKRLCEFQFHPEKPERRIAPAKLHHRKQLETYDLWKIELAVIGVRSNQSPRVWFAVSGSMIAFLASGSHVDNYNDNDMELLALERAGEIF